ncbi:MAG: TetR family transcriptional regulator, partial [Actinobacteria bacterium]|nr:TetR family transcriptional regulator [Actinomycetota bacterium]
MVTAPVKADGRVARRQGTRELIMAAATELFAARGVTSTSIDDIAEAAGIAKGSIYYNFESK